MKVVHRRPMKILVIEDEPSVRLGLCNALKQAGHVVSSAANGPEGISLFQKDQHDLVVTDLVMSGGGGMEVLAAVKEVAPKTGVVVMTGFGNVKTAVEAMRNGAFDYITKPFDPDELQIAIDKFTRQANLEHENFLLREEVREKHQFENIIGESPEIIRLCDTISTVAHSDASVLILGETGTGKEMVASALCLLSARYDKPFVKINCAAIPETLFESELFGYEKGAFTGAQARRKGKLEAAHGGTVLLDEIGDMPLIIQSKLLRVIEERKLERLGGNESVNVDIRLLCATAKNLKNAVRKGTFREDLYYRINVLPLNVPPLRERREDIPLLIRHFLDEFSKRAGKSGIVMSPAAMTAMSHYDYPGNIRELKHAMEMAVTLCTDGVITLLHLPADIREANSEGAVTSGAESPFMTDQVRRLERDLISKALEDTEGKRAAAADKLGICRRTLWKKMRDLGMVDQLGEDYEEPAASL